MEYSKFTICSPQITQAIEGEQNKVFKYEIQDKHKQKCNSYFTFKTHVTFRVNSNMIAYSFNKIIAKETFLTKQNMPFSSIGCKQNEVKTILIKYLLKIEYPEYVFSQISLDLIITPINIKRYLNDKKLALYLRYMAVADNMQILYNRQHYSQILTS
jgi:hypothetical protein